MPKQDLLGPRLLLRLHHRRFRAGRGARRVHSGLSDRKAAISLACWFDLLSRRSRCSLALLWSSPTASAGSLGWLILKTEGALQDWGAWALGALVRLIGVLIGIARRGEPVDAITGAKPQIAERLVLVAPYRDFCRRCRS